MSTMSELQNEIQELSKKKVQYSKDKVAGVATLNREYRAKIRKVEIDASYKVKPLAEEQSKKMQQLGEEHRSAVAKIETQSREEIARLKRQLQADLSRAESKLQRSRDTYNKEHSAKTEEIRVAMKTDQQDLRDEQAVAVETLEAEYDERIADCDAQLEVLLEALKVEQEEAKKEKEEAKKASAERRKGRRAQEKIARKRA